MRIERVLAPNPGVYTLDGTNTWVVGRDPAVVIDPGPAVAAHLDAVIAAADGPVAAVLVTHDHEDHAEAASELARRLGARLRALRVTGSEPMPDGAAVVVRDDGAEVELAAVATPGHTADHLAFWIARARALFTGDAVLGAGTSFIDPPDGDLAAYMRSLAKMQRLEPVTIYPGHVPVVTDAAGKLREYTEHRLDRERQVVAALAGGPKTVDEIVLTVYAAYPMDVRPLAARQVLAHLRKLESEGRARTDAPADGAAWSAISSERS